MVGFLTLNRVALVISYLWQGMQHGRKCEQLAVRDLNQPHGSPLPLPLPCPFPSDSQVGMQHGKPLLCRDKQL